MIVFVDTNIFLDVLLDRKPLADSSEQVLNICSRPGFKMYTSDISFANITYFAVKYRPSESRALLRTLLGKVHIADTPAAVFEKALTSDLKDLEDAYQLFTAMRIRGIKYLITRNGKDFISNFAATSLKVLTPDEFLAITPATS